LCCVRGDAHHLIVRVDPGSIVTEHEREDGVTVLAREVAACDDLEQLRAVLASKLTVLLPVSDRVSIALLEPDGEWLRVHRIFPVAEAPRGSLPRVRVEGTPVGQVAREGTARVVADVRADPNITFGQASHDGIRSTVSVPIRMGARVIGAMNAGSRTPGACTEPMLHVMEQIAQVVGPVFYALEQRGAPSRGQPTELVGASAAFRSLLATARRTARTDVDVLITGETGVGKTALARAIHAWSPRREGPFVTVHLADLAPTLVETELFGYERGAFTGASATRVGRFESAAGGTILLDEIGETPPAIQAKLLRIIQERCFERVGGTRTIDADVRIIAATNTDLRAAVQRREFREDLFFRLCVVPLHLPPLRERREDLDELIDAILSRLATRRRLSPAARARVHAYDWPGNIRELEAVLHAATILEDSDEIELAGVTAVAAAASVTARDANRPWQTLREHERAYIEEVLRAHEGAVEGAAGAARVLGVPPSTLRSRMKKLGITSQRGKGRTR
jgi:formate hydrogenlyase transcriptional activator